MSKKKRQTVTLVVLCLVLIAAGVGYYALTRYQASKEKAEKAEEEKTEGLFQLSSDDICKVDFKGEKASLTFDKDGKTWKLSSDKNYPLNQDRIVDMVDETTGVAATQTVTTSCGDLTEYNLDKPDLTVTVTDNDGKDTTIYVGMESVAGGGRYAYCGGDEKKVYLISTSLYDSFNYSLGELMKVPELPSVQADEIRYLKLESATGKSFEAEYDEKNSPYKDIYGWSIKQPYTQPVAGDKDQLQNLFGSYTNLDLGSGVTYKKDAALEKKYGLDAPAYTLSFQTAKKKLTLYFGKETKDQSSYYVKVKGEDGIYLMDASTVSTLVNINALDYVYQRLYVGDKEKLDQVELSYNGKKYTFDVSKKKKKSETEYTYTITSGGKKVDSDTFNTAYSVISYLAPGGNIDKKVTVKSNKPVAEFTFREEKKTTKMIILPYDGKNFYRVSVNGVMQFTADKSAVDKVIKQFTSLK